MSQEFKFTVKKEDKDIIQRLNELDGRGNRSEWLRDAIRLKLAQESQGLPKVEKPEPKDPTYRIYQLVMHKQVGIDISYELKRDLENGVLEEIDIAIYYLAMKGAIIDIQNTKVLDWAVLKYTHEISSKRASTSRVRMNRVKEKMLEELNSRFRPKKEQEFVPKNNWTLTQKMEHEKQEKYIEENLEEIEEEEEITQAPPTIGYDDGIDDEEKFLESVDAEQV